MLEFFLPFGRVRELFSLFSGNPHRATCPPRARFHRLARINVRAQKPTDPSRNTTHRGLSSEGRKPGNYYVSRETRGNPDFFFPPPVKDFKGIILASGRNFLRDVNFFAGRDTVSFARIRVLLLRQMYYRENIITHERELPSFFVSSNRRELSVISLFVSWGISVR